MDFKKLFDKIAHFIKSHEDNGHEKNLPTPQYAAQAYPRFSCAYGDEKRPQDHQRTPCERPQEALCLSRLNVLKHNREFQQVYRKGKSAHSPALVLFFLPDASSRIAVGFTASKKVGNAVKRNRAKRRMRALFRAFEPRLSPGRYVLVAKTATAELPFSELERHFSRLLKRVGALKQ